VRRDNAFAGLQFHDDFARHDEVSAELAERDALERHGKYDLAFQLEAAAAQIDRHRIRIDAFGIAPAECVIRVVERADDVVGDFAVQQFAHGS
jgi:hypothetical protein